jgi:CheY-like chemotaxis protein
MISVMDTGCGISESIRHRIFDPFFTTKIKGKGTGMGLAMVYGIVENLGGTICVNSEIGCGTTVKVYIPVPESIVLAGDSMKGDTPGRGPGRILIIDDEEIVCTVASVMLKDLGYGVTSYLDGQEAVEYYKEHCNEIDLVMLDMMMPGMGGGECFRLLREINPAVRVVLTTGYGLDGMAQELLDEGVIECVQKPYIVADLSKIVADALAS